MEEEEEMDIMVEMEEALKVGEVEDQVIVRKMIMFYAKKAN